MNYSDRYYDPPEPKEAPCICGGSQEDHCDYAQHTPQERLELCEATLAEIEHILTDQTKGHQLGDLFSRLQLVLEKRYRSCAHCDECLGYREDLE